jgi:RNA polymerase sigma-70 factor (ECF subfamily)
MSQAERSESSAPRWAKRAHDDAALLRRVARADTTAFEALYRVYFPRLHRFLERVTHRVTLVEEILDDTMLVVWQKASTFNGQSLVSTWIFAIAYRKALKALQRLDEPIVDSDDNAAEDPEPDAAMMHAELRELLVDAIGRMSPVHRAVIELTYYQGCAYSEIAAIMECPVDTVKTRMFHARRHLRRLIGERQEDLL